MNTDLGLFILRVGAGAFTLTHGIPKLLNFGGTMKWLRGEGFPLPVVSTLGVTLAETVGAAMVLLGIYAQWAALVLAFSMLVAGLYHIKKGDSWKNMEDAWLYCVVFLAIAVAGAGAWAIL